MSEQLCMIADHKNNFIKVVFIPVPAYNTGEFEAKRGGDALVIKVLCYNF